MCTRAKLHASAHVRTNLSGFHAPITSSTSRDKAHVPDLNSSGRRKLKHCDEDTAYYTCSTGHEQVAVQLYEMNVQTYETQSAVLLSLALMVHNNRENPSTKQWHDERKLSPGWISIHNTPGDSSTKQNIVVDDTIHACSFVHVEGLPRANAHSGPKTRSFSN